MDRNEVINELVLYAYEGFAIGQKVRDGLSAAPDSAALFYQLKVLSQAKTINWIALIEIVTKIADIIIPLIGGATNATTRSNPIAPAQVGTGETVGSVPDSTS